jgi:prepilin signal peptidase PulO-like enzyme (type II secretory pathway)
VDPYSLLIIGFSLLLHLGFGWIFALMPEMLSPNLPESTRQKPYWIIPILVVIGGGLTWLVLSFSISKSPYLLADLILLQVLYWVSVTDVAYRIIPNRILLLGLIGWSFILIVETAIFSWWNLGIAGIVGITFFVINMISNYITSRQGFGYGDIKLLLLISLFLGTNVLIAITLAVILGGVCSLLLLVLGKTTRKSRLPFAPFVLSGVITYYLLYYIYSLII